MEFIEAMKIFKRICKANNCANCILKEETSIFCRDYILNYPEKAEEIFAKWAEVEKNHD